jgi:CheY-like chemotaxis protein
MPEMDGVAFIQQVRSMSDGTPIPVIVVSALNDRAIRRSALEAGANDVLVKPVDHDEFRARARNLLALSDHHTKLSNHLSAVITQLNDLQQRNGLPQQGFIAATSDSMHVRKGDIAVSYDDFFGVTSTVTAIHQLLEPVQEKIAILEKQLQMPLRGGTPQSPRFKQRNAEWPSANSVSDNAAELPMALGQVLRSLREERGWNLEYVSELCKTSAANISKIELGRSREFRLDFLKELACVFGTNLYHLIALAEGTQLMDTVQLHSDEHDLIVAFRTLDHAQRQMLGKVVQALVKP